MNGAVAALDFRPLTEAEQEAAADVQASRAQADDWRPVVPVPEDAARTMPPHSLGKWIARWPYRDAKGRLLFLAVRFEPVGERKEVIPLTYCEKDGRRAWRWQALPAPRPLYGLDKLAARPEAPVLVTEGEKKVEPAEKFFPEYVAVTSPGGSGAAGKADWTPLKGRRVTVWPDADDAGRRYADDVARLAHAAGAASVAVVPVPEDFPEGWDLADAPPDGWTAERLRAELLEKAISWESKAGPREPTEAEHGIIYRCIADVEAKPIRWLWPGRIARGKVSMIAGHPGLGKSQVTASLAAIVTTGGLWPVDRTRAERGSAIFLTAEDDAEDTLRPRLEAVGADLPRVYILDAVREKTDAGKTRVRGFSLADDIARLDSLLATRPDVSVLVVDPVSAYLGGVDSHKNADVRALLAPLAEMAARHGVAVVCVSHLNKGTGNDALMRVTGSLGFVAAARAVYVVAKDDKQAGRRLFLPLKNNLGNDESGFAFSIESHRLPGGIETSRVAWEAEPVTTTADEALAPAGDPEERNALDDAKEFLAALLADGPMRAKKVFAEAREAGHAERTIRRAQKALAVEAIKDGLKGGWQWRLPPKMAKGAEDGQAQNVATFGGVGHLREGEDPAADTEEVVL